jgi:hypothetical protein
MLELLLKEPEFCRYCRGRGAGLNLNQLPTTLIGV